MLDHGGRLHAAARARGIALERWLDLSTGISPFAYPLPVVPAESWHRLPEDDDGLLDAAAEYFGVPDLLPIAGSQAVIQLLPRLWPKSTVVAVRPTYKEHPHAWRRYGHTVLSVEPEEVLERADNADVVIICNPENPTGMSFTADALLKLHSTLRRQGGLLLVDEAFIDVTPEHSVIASSASEGLIVLRSLGKFFGMGGARVGFVAANRALLAKLQEELGPWTITGPSRFAALQALKDTAFQQKAKERLQATSSRLQAVLKRAGLEPSGSTAFFQWVKHPNAKSIFDALLDQAVLARYYDDPGSIRFGLPADDTQFERLEKALEALADLVVPERAIGR